MAHAAMENGDWVGLAGKNALKTDNGARHYTRILTLLHELKPEKTFSPPHIENRRSKELFVVISDLYDENDELTDFIKSLKSKRNDVIVFHLLGQKERRLEFGSAVKFKDLELDRSLQVNADAYRETYQQDLTNWTHNLANGFMVKGIDYNLVDFCDPIADVINEFINHRRQLN
jgi:hypothetical protein